MDKDSIKQIIMRGQEVLTSRTYRRRELSIPFSEIFRLEKVIAIIGPRRVGKTYYLRQALNEMHARIQEAIFIDFSEIGSQQLQAEDFPLLLSCYFELFPDLTSPVFLLDEIQELAGFEPALKYLLNRQLRVIITGSNSRNLIPELASSLRGKVLSWNLMPLSFGEFLDFRQIEQERSNYTVAGRGRIFRAFSEYLEWGGFPEIVLSRDADLKTHLLSSYIDVMLFRDVVERHNVTNIPVLKELFLRILRSGTKGFSLNKCYNTLKSMGMRIGKDTLFLYLSYLEDSLFVLLIENQKNPRLLPKKVYLADTGLYQYLQPLSPDTGSCSRTVSSLICICRDLPCSSIRTRNGRLTSSSPRSRR